jgi:hypothetical protein
MFKSFFKSMVKFNKVKLNDPVCEKRELIISLLSTSYLIGTFPQEFVIPIEQL